MGSSNSTNRRLLLGLLLLGLVTRFAAIFGHSLHFDEPFWMLRGEWLFEQVGSGNWRKLTTEFWNVTQVDPEGPRYAVNVGTGTPTAILTGLGQKLGGTENQASLDRVVYGRFFHALLASLTPALLTGLAWACGLSGAGLTVFGSFLLLTPHLRTYTSIAHMESVLAVAVLGSVLLFGLGRQRRQWFWIGLGGVVFGVGFATRVNAGVAFLTLLVLIGWGVVTRLHSRERRWRDLGLIELLVFGSLGYAAFLVLFPPIWSDPARGFFDFLSQYSLAGEGRSQPLEVVLALFPTSWIWINQIFVLLALAGLVIPELRSHRLFQLGWVLLLVSLATLSFGSTPANARYMASVVPALGLAGAVSAGTLWLRLDAGSWRRWAQPGLWLFLVLFSLTSVYRDRQRQLELERFYEMIPVQDFSEVQFWRPDFRITRTQPKEGARLHVATWAWHVPIVYLGIGLSDRRRIEYWLDGWTRDPTTLKNKVCAAGDWMLAEQQDVVPGLIGRRQLNTLVVGRCP